MFVFMCLFVLFLFSNYSHTHQKIFFDSLITSHNLFLKVKTRTQNHGYCIDSEALSNIFRMQQQNFYNLLIWRKRSKQTVSKTHNTLENPISAIKMNSNWNIGFFCTTLHMIYRTDSQPKGRDPFVDLSKRSSQQNF